jgi:hypothetical protein
LTGSPSRKADFLSANTTRGAMADATNADMKAEPMVSGKDLRRIALSLQGTTEAPHFDRAAFKVARIYATLAADGRTANLKLSPEEQEFKCMLAPEAFAPVPGGWGKQGWTTVTLSALSTPELGDVLEIAWRHALPRIGTKTRARR